jgi:hypothetical protein
VFGVDYDCELAVRSREPRDKDSHIVAVGGKYLRDLGVYAEGV